MTTTRLIDDLRSLGTGAAGRAAYEASKRFGGHDLVFGRLASSSGVASTLVPPLPAPSRTIPTEISDRTLAAAASIVEGRIRIFGRDLPLPPEPDWSATIEGEGSWPAEPWWRIDVRSDRRIADVKWTWELNRHRHLVVLARALYLAPDDGQTASFLTSQLRSWVEQNPPEQGINWYSNLEIALRALAWLQVLALASPVLPSSVIIDMTRLLHHSARHLLADLPYTVSSMRNNHLLGDALGLVALGKSFPSDAAARRWASIGDRILVRQLRRHMKPDGSMIEDSLGYHRFVLDMLCIRASLGAAPSPVREAMVAAGQFLARLGVGDGPVPQYGDWDEGRAAVGLGDPADLRGSLHLALALAGTGAPEAWRAEHDEVCWYAGPGEPVEPASPEVGGHPIGGGIARAQVGRFTVWLKAGSGPSHGHADLCTTTVAAGDRWVIGDPGTGTYNGPLDQRNYFRSSAAHSALRVGGHDLLEPYRAFRWRYAASGVIGPPLRHHDRVVLWGIHDAYCRLQVPRRVARVVVLENEAVTVADWVSGPPGERFELALPLAPHASWAGHTLTLPGGETMRLELPLEPIVVCGSASPYVGWWSETYGHAVPAARLEVTGVIGEPVWWAIGSAESPRPWTDGASLHLGALQVEVEWSRDHARLIVREGALDQLALVGTSG